MGYKKKYLVAVLREIILHHYLSPQEVKDKVEEERRAIGGWIVKGQYILQADWSKGIEALKRGKLPEALKPSVKDTEGGAE